MDKKPILFDTNETQPDTSRPGGRSWIFQGSEKLTIQYSEIFSDPESMTHVHTDYEQVIMITQGKANFWCGDEYYELSAGCIMVVPPNVPHGIQSRTDSTEDLKVIEIFCPKANERTQSPRVSDAGHLNWEKLTEK